MGHQVGSVPLEEDAPPDPSSLRGMYLKMYLEMYLFSIPRYMDSR